MNLSMQDDYRVWDNVEPVTYTHVARTGNTSDSLPLVKRRALKASERAESGGVYVAQDVVFLIPAVLMPGHISPPKPADLVTDADGIEYTVLEVGQNKRSITRGQPAYGTWRLITRDLIVAEDLRDAITIETAGTGTLDTTSAEVKAWRPLFQNVACRVQLVDQVEHDARGIRGTPGKYLIYLAKEIAGITTRDRVVWPAALGGYLEITGYRQRQRITDLPVLECLLSP